MPGAGRSWNLLLKAGIVLFALLALMGARAVSAHALPTCESSYAPTSVAGASNAATATTAVSVTWQIPSAVEKELTEEQVTVWPANELPEDGRHVLDKETTARTFVFNNSGEKSEAAAGSEPGFIEPATAYDVAVTAVYGTSTKYPEGCAVESKAASSVATRHIFGTNGGLCCSKKPSEGLIKNAETLVSDGIAADRVESNLNPETEAEETFGNTPKMASEHNLVNNDVLVGNVLDSEKLSKVNLTAWTKEALEQVENAAKYGDVLMEVGNEMWLKGQCSECAEPVKYAEMFVSLSKEVAKAKESKAIPQDVKLLFDLTGDYESHGEWSNATEKRGWLGDAVNAKPELKTRIEGFTFHPYDPAGETLAEEEKLSTYEYDWGLRGLKEDDAEAVELGVKHTNVFATEFGACVYKLIGGECRNEGTKKTEAEALKEAETNYDELLTSSEFPEVKGLWWYGTYPGEAQWYSFFKGWGGGEATELLKFVSGPALSNAPTVEAKAATSVGETEATLHGAVNPNGQETKYDFEYGTTEAYGSKTTETSAGSGTSSTEVTKVVTGLVSNTKYYFRLVATNRDGTSVSPPQTFTTPTGIPSDLSGMAVTDPFNGTATAVSNFTSNWSTLGWASEKGSDGLEGWRPVAAFPAVTGAYYAPTITDVGSGIADVVTMAKNPSLEERYFSLWLDLSSPGGTRAGYQLTFRDVSSGTYEVKLSKWVGGTQTVLSSKAGYAFANGSSLALVDQGAVVSAWTNTGSGFTELLKSSDSTFEGGQSGVEGSGNITRLTNFKVGELLTPVAKTSAALEALALNDSFATNETHLSGGGAFAALSWDTAPAEDKTGQVLGGWGPIEAYPAIAGAYWQKASFADTGAGVAVSAKLSKNPEIASRYFALWLDMPSPASARSGYEVRFKETSTGIYEVTLAKWSSGTETVLGSKASYAFSVGSLLALDDDEGVVSVWTKTGTEYTELLSASDATFTSGYTGIEGAGNIERLKEFKSGPLPPI